MPTLKDKLIESIKESQGSKDFRHYYIKKNEEWFDTSKNGRLSCAIFVSRKLAEFSGLVICPHATVESTVRDLEKSGWYKINEPKEGAVIVWEDILRSDEKMHSHIGFVLNQNLAISNNGAQGVPWQHHLTKFDEELGQGENVPERKIKDIYWHKFLDEPTE